MEKATVFKIAKTSDREYLKGWTKIYLKGCPLRCKWCDTPESFRRTPDFFINDETCVQCGKCVDSCTSAALYVEAARIIHNVSNCQMCDKCISVCPNHSIRIIGNTVRSDELLAKILEDQESNGVIISGGEPYMQPKFTLEMLKALKEHGVPTAVDTSGYTSMEHLKQSASFVDYFLYDIKHIDSKVHSKYTGVSNQLILENLKELCSLHSNVILRIPLIEGFNTDEETLDGLFSLAAEYGISQVQLLPFLHTERERFYHIAAFELSDAQFEPLREESLELALSIGKRHGISAETAVHDVVELK